MAKILIVEDEFIVSTILRKKLAAAGHEICDQAVTGEEAIEKAVLHHPEIIYMDISLASEMSGIEAARTILQTEKPFFVFSSGFPSSEMELEVKSLNSIGYFVKPVKFSELIQVIDRAIGTPQKSLV